MFTGQRCLPRLRDTLVESLPPRRPLVTMPYSLCHGCSSARKVSGRLDQTYLLCRNEAVAEKYPVQPVRACGGYRPVPVDEPGPRPAP